MKNLISKLIGLAILLALFFWAITPSKTVLKGQVSGLNKGKLVIKSTGNKSDTIITDRNGGFKYKVKVEKDNPLFTYVFYKDNLLAGLILQKGETCVVEADTIGNYSVKGSPESERFRNIENARKDFMRKLSSQSYKLEQSSGYTADVRIVRNQISRDYIEYYRDRIAYILKNLNNISTIPVVYQEVGDGLPILSQSTDVFIIKQLADSLSKKYPKSSEVKMLQQTVKERENVFSLRNKFSEAKVVGFPDMALPDINGNTIRLSEIKSKVVMLYFWRSEPAQKMLNLDVLEPLYRKYHDRGLEIYAISLDTDKGQWASGVKSQKLEWINVCDGLGANSPSVVAYAVKNLPTSFIIHDGVLVDNTSIKDEKSLRFYLDKVLK